MGIDATNGSTRTSALTLALGAATPPSGEAHTPGETLLPAPAPQVGDVGEAVARMVLESAFERKKAARDERKAAESAMVAAGEQQIAHLREQAEVNYDSALLQATGRIATGALGVAAGAMGPVGEACRNAPMISLSPAVREAGTLAGGVVDAMAAAPKRTADHFGASAKADEMRASAEKARLDGAGDELRDVEDAARSALDFLREFKATQSKTQSAAASMRA
jgi:hypothetical protein